MASFDITAFSGCQYFSFKPGVFNYLIFVFWRINLLALQNMFPYIVLLWKSLLTLPRFFKKTLKMWSPLFVSFISISFLHILLTSVWFNFLGLLLCQVAAAKMFPASAIYQNQNRSLYIIKQGHEIGTWALVFQDFIFRKQRRIKENIRRV